MATVKEYIRSLKNVEKELKKEIPHYLTKKGTIMTAVKYRLYNRGLDGYGKKMGKYTDQTISRKKKNARFRITSHVTLADTGTWRDNLLLKVDGDTMFLDNKMTSLTNKLINGGGKHQNPPYGQGIIELSRDEVMIAESLIEDFINKKFKGLPIIID